MIVINPLLLAMIVVLLAASVAVVDDVIAQETVREKIKEKVKDKVEEVREKVEEFKDTPGLEDVSPELVEKFREKIREELKKVRAAIAEFVEERLADTESINELRSEGFTMEEIRTMMAEDFGENTQRVKALKMIMNGEVDMGPGEISSPERIESFIDDITSAVIAEEHYAKFERNPPERTLEEMRSYAYQISDIQDGFDTTSVLAKIFEDVEITGLSYSEYDIWITVDPYVNHAIFTELDYALFHYWGDVVNYKLERNGPVILLGEKSTSTTPTPTNTTSEPTIMTKEELIPHLGEVFNVLIGNSTNQELLKAFENVSMTSLHIKDEIREIDSETIMLAGVIEIGLDCTGITAEQFDDRFSNLVTGLEKYWGEKGIPYVLECVDVVAPYVAEDSAAISGFTAQSSSGAGKFTAQSSSTTSSNITKYTIFEDDFESGLGKWYDTKNVWNATTLDEDATIPGHTGSNKVAKVDVCPATYCWLMLDNGIDLTQYDNATLEFDRFVDNEIDSGEHLTFWEPVGNGGSSWRTHMKWTHGQGDDDQWQHVSIDLAPYLSNNNFKIAFTGMISETAEEVAIDNVRISYTTNGTAPTPPPHPRTTVQPLKMVLSLGLENG